MKYNHKHEWTESKEKTQALNAFFANICPLKTYNKKITTYDLKHLFEVWAKKVGFKGFLHVYSDEFIWHAQKNGFKFKQIKVSSCGDPMGFLNLSNKDLQRITKKTLL